MASALRALIVDDDADDYVFTRDLLTEIGDDDIELHWEISYDDALARMLQEDFDIFLLDYRLGQHTGVELLRAAQAHGCRVPAILLTGVDARDVDEEARAVGAASFIQKQVMTAEGLERSIRYAIDQAKRVDALQSMSDFGYAVLDALSAHIAVVDADGGIIALNRAWHTFAAQNGVQGANPGIGVNYFAVSHDAVASGDPHAIAVVHGLRAVLSGSQDLFYHEYPCDSPTGEQWFAVRITALDDGQRGRGVIAHEDITARRQSEERERLLSTISDALQESLNPETTLTRLVSLLVPTVADWCSVALVDSGRLLRRVAVVHADPEKASLASALMHLPLDPQSPTGLPSAIRSGRPFVDAEVRIDAWRWEQSSDYVRVHRSLGISSQMNVPLVARGRVIGGIAFIVGDSGRRYTDADLPFVEEIARRAALAIDNARLHHDLLESEAKYRTLVEQMPGTVYLAAPDDLGNLLYQSPQIARMLGYTPEEWLQYPSYWHTRLHPDDVERVHASDTHAVATGEPFTLDYRSIRRDDRIVWVRDYGVLIRDEQGEPMYWLGITLDITEHKQAEDALKKSERHLRDVIDNIPAVTYTYVYEGVTEQAAIDVSRQIMSILGYPPEELKTWDGWVRLIHPDDRERVAAEAIRTDQSGDPYDVTYRARAADGSWRWVRNVAVRTRHSVGEPDIWQGFLFDVTDHKVAETGLRESEARFRSAFDDAAIAMALITLDGTFLRVNRAYCQMLGYQEHELFQLNAHMVTHPDDRDAGNMIAAQMIEGVLDVSSMAKRYISRDGSIIWGSLTSSLVRDDTGTPLYYISQVQDITERKRAEAITAELASIVASSADAITSSDAEGRVTSWNRGAEQLYGYPPHEMLGQPLRVIAPADQRDELEETRQRVMAGESNSYLETVRQRKDGSLVDVAVTISPIRNTLGEVIGTSAIAHDITERRRAIEALRESEAWYRSLIHHFPNGAILLFDHDLRFLVADGTALEAIGIPGPEFVGRTLREAVSPEGVAILEPVYRAALNGEHREFEMTARGREFLVNSVPVLGEGERVIAGMVMAVDITERKELERQITHQAFHDSLTGLPNRALMHDRIEQALASARRYNQQVAVLFLDLDNFKVINDSLGHARGDELLIEVAKRLNECVRETDTVNRFGGDEFVIMLTGVTSADDVVNSAYRIAAALDQPIGLGNWSGTVSTSIGIVISDGTEEVDDLLRHADIAMYRAKSSGKNQIEVYDAALNERAVMRLELEQELRRAIDNGDFMLYYQPIVSLDTGKTLGVEALVRWQHPTRGIVSPADFIPIAEETGLIVPLGSWVLVEASHQVAAWNQLAPDKRPLTISVNLSARQFRQPALIAQVVAILNTTDLDPACLVLEITETVVMDDADESVERLHALKALGVAISVDDFGTGYSSLSYLKRFPVDVIKIDRSFVSGLGQTDEDTAIVTAIISMAHALGIRVVAEGVETREQMEHLQRLGCDRAQGYYFARPAPAAEIFAIPREEVPV